MLSLILMLSQDLLFLISYLFALQMLFIACWMYALYILFICVFTQSYMLLLSSPSFELHHNSRRRCLKLKVTRWDCPSCESCYKPSKHFGSMGHILSHIFSPTVSFQPFTFAVLCLGLVPFLRFVCGSPSNLSVLSESPLKHLAYL